MDIEALSLLGKQKCALRSLPKPADPSVTFETYEEKIQTVMSATESVIAKVAKYAEQIFDELQSVREVVKNCSVKIGEQLKELMKNHFLKGEITYAHGGEPITRDDLDTKKLEQSQALQRLAKQQQDLMMFIAKTENLVLKIEEGSGMSLFDIKGVTNSLQQWSDGLETVKEKERRLAKEKQEEERRKREKEKEERRKIEEKEREKREKEEEERRRKEKEEKEKEEKRKRQEEERKKRDWKNWPPFIYHNPRMNKFKQDLCCVIFTMPDNISQNDFISKGSDTEDDLDKCLETNDEQVLSSVITITPNKNKKITFELPIRVYVPIVHHDAKLVPSLKFSIKGKKWRRGRALPEVKVPNVQNVSFVGVEIRVKELSSIQCVAVASYRKEITDVDDKGKVFEPDGDRNIKVKIPANAFPGTTIVTTQSVPWTQKDIRNAAIQHKELHNVRTAGSFLDISCENVTNEDSDLEMYDFGWVVDKDINKNHSVHQETLYRSSRWLVNNMNPDVNALPLQDVFDSDFLEELETTETTGDKNRLILRGLHESSDSKFGAFVKSLRTTQAQVASRIKNVYDQVVMSRESEKYSEDDFGNDFDPDFEKKEGELRVVSKVSGKSWEIVQIEASETHHKARFIKLPAGNAKYQVLGLVVPNDMSHDNICRAAEILESLHCVTNVSVICRQKHTNRHDVIIDCVLSENVASTMQHLDGLGYSAGPAESSTFGVVDGEEIVLKFEGNLFLERLKNVPLKIKFYKNVPPERYSGHLAVGSKAEQWDSDQYHGHMTFEVALGRLSVPRKGTMTIYVPKPMEEMIGKFAYTLDVPVKALAKFIAWQLTRENFNSSRWVRLGGYLTDEDSGLYHQIIKHVDTERPKAPQRERCEHFIVDWSTHYSQKAVDKIEKIISAHHDPKFESEAQQFIRAYISGKGIFSNDTMEKIAYAISEDWEALAKKLGFGSDDINKIKSMHGFKVKQGLQMLDWWRLSDTAIQKGTDLVKSFHETAKSAQLGARLLTLVSSHM